MRPPIVLCSSAGAVRWSATTVRELGAGFDEKYLERRIGEYPALLGLEDLESHISGPYKALHQLVLETPTGQVAKPDILLLTQSGHVVVVEVKLEDNEELWGREVIAQALDYAASLATYDERDLMQLLAPDLAPKARLVDAVRQFFPGAEAPAIAGAILRRIRSGEVHVVIACDHAPDELRDYVEAVSAQRSLGAYTIRVVEIVPYVREGAVGSEVLLVPGAVTSTEIVMRTAVEVVTNAQAGVSVNVATTPLSSVVERVGGASGAKRAPPPELLAAVAAYEAAAEPGTTTFGRAADHRKVFVDGWPGDIHYEFLVRRTPFPSIRVELHFESDEYAGVAEKVRAAVPSASKTGLDLQWDPNWMKAGRIGVPFALDREPGELAEAMAKFVRLTRPLVDKALHS